MKQLLGFIARLLITTSILAFLHDLLVRYTELEFDRLTLTSTYTFLFIATALVYVLCFWIVSKNSEYGGISYMGFSLLKMMAFLIFLLPAIKADDPSLKPIILQQVAAYLGFLVFEVLSVYKLLRNYLK